MPVSELFSDQEALAQLNLPVNFTDDSLATYIGASTRAVERHVGAIVSKDLVETYDGGGPAIVLRSRPVLAVTSVTDAGTVLDPSQYKVYADAGILARVVGNFDGSSPLSVTVAYTVGRDVVEDDWKLAGLIILQDLWATKRASAGPVPGGASGGGDEALVRANYRLPRRALELLGAAVPGIA